MGMRAALRAGTEIQAMGFHTKSAHDDFRTFAEGATQALDERDAEFGDYSTRKSVTANSGLFRPPQRPATSGMNNPG